VNFRKLEPKLKN